MWLQGCLCGVSVTVSPVAVICGCRHGYHSDGECVVAVLSGSPLSGRVTAVTVIVWLAQCLYGCVHVTVTVWLLLCVPSDGGGGAVIVFQCVAVITCLSCVALCVSLCHGPCLCPRVAMWLWLWMAQGAPRTVSVDERLLMCVILCLVIGGVTL